MMVATNVFERASKKERDWTGPKIADADNLQSEEKLIVSLFDSLASRNRGHGNYSNSGVILAT